MTPELIADYECVWRGAAVAPRRGRLYWTDIDTGRLSATSRLPAGRAVLPGEMVGGAPSGRRRCSSSWPAAPSNAGRGRAHHRDRRSRRSATPRFNDVMPTRPAASSAADREARLPASPRYQRLAHPVAHRTAASNGMGFTPDRKDVAPTAEAEIYPLTMTRRPAPSAIARLPPHRRTTACRTDDGDAEGCI